MGLTLDRSAPVPPLFFRSIVSSELGEDFNTFGLLSPSSDDRSPAHIFPIFYNTFNYPPQSLTIQTKTKGSFRQQLLAHTHTHTQTLHKQPEIQKRIVLFERSFFPKAIKSSIKCCYIY